MVRISISPTAFQAVASTMPFGSAGYENKRTWNGGCGSSRKRRPDRHPPKKVPLEEGSSGKSWFA
jgi:hypothetical protein